MKIKIVHKPDEWLTSLLVVYVNLNEKNQRPVIGLRSPGKKRESDVRIIGAKNSGKKTVVIAVKKIPDCNGKIGQDPIIKMQQPGIGDPECS